MSTDNTGFPRLATNDGQEAQANTPPPLSSPAPSSEADWKAYFGSGTPFSILSPSESKKMSDASDEKLDLNLRLIKAELEAGHARIASVESRIETSLARMPTRWEFYGLAVTIMGLVLGILAWGGDRFDGGVQLASTAAVQSAETQQITKENANQIKALVERANKNDAQLDALFERLIGPKKDAK